MQFVLENPEDDVLDYGILEEADIVTKTFTLHNPNPIRVSSRKAPVHYNKVPLSGSVFS